MNVCHRIVFAKVGFHKTELIVSDDLTGSEVNKCQKKKLTSLLFCLHPERLKRKTKKSGLSLNKYNFHPAAGSEKERPNYSQIKHFQKPNSAIEEPSGRRATTAWWRLGSRWLTRHQGLVQVIASSAEEHSIKLKGRRRHGASSDLFGCSEKRKKSC